MGRRCAVLAAAAVTAAGSFGRHSLRFSRGFHAGLCRRPAAVRLLQPRWRGVSCLGGRQPMQDMEQPKIGFITDCEGNFDYWSKCVELSEVVHFDDAGQLCFSRSDKADKFIFGGDAFDKGPGDIRIATALVNFKRRHPERVWMLAGNRDLNKLRFTAELGEEVVDVPHPVPAYPRAPPQCSLRDFLQQQAGGDAGGDLAAVNSSANRLRWILDHTMTAKGAFELRREELALLQDKVSSTVSDDEVVESFLDSVVRNDGFVWEYLTECSLAVLFGETLFVHAGVPKDALGWIPSLDMRYLQPSETSICGGTQLPEGHTLREWVDAMNDFLRAGLRDFRAQMSWRSDRSRGGEGLLAFTSTPASFQRSIVVESLLQGGMPTDLSPEVEDYLSRGGVRRVICGHKPCGDSPFVVMGKCVEFVHCDTTYSDESAKDKRGQVAAAVEVESVASAGQETESRLHLRGSLSDGRVFDFLLPSRGSQGSAELPGSHPEKVVSGSSAEHFVGHRTVDGWWVKARLADGSYHLAHGEPGSRKVSYTTRTYEELSSGMQLQAGL
ncbi:unnamed protein product [Polarella glacialis]|uniref:Calcineurin-like phosphoesterase domain-containing protein n=1 Tax=Polarella glacialis TaxID=89957 RepID=A0A813E935_POLGL|nr:unnamed protein product [Polarella glacialis]